MATDIEICSQSLTLLRAETINSFSETSEEAEICDIHYPDFVKDILSRYPWSFAQKKASLTLNSNHEDDGDPVNEWAYAHQLPSDNLRIIAIYNTDKVGAKPYKQWKRVGDYIHSNESELWALYIYEVPESSWPGYFVQFAVHAFAALIAMPVTDDERVAAYWKRVAYGTDEENERGGKFGVAASVDAQATTPEEVATPDLVAARFS